MPAALPFLAYVGANALGYSAIAASAAAFVTSLGVASWQRSEARAAARRKWNDSVRDRHVTIRSAVAPRNLVLGKVRVGGALVYADSLGTDKLYLDQVIAVSGHELDGIDGVYLGDEYLPFSGFTGSAPTSGKYSFSKLKRRVESYAINGATLTVAGTPDGASSVTVVIEIGSGEDATRQSATVQSVVGSLVTLTQSYTGTASVLYDSREGGPSLRVQYGLGTAAQAATDWSVVPLTTPYWTSNHRLRGCGYVRTLFKWNENAWETGALPVSAVVRGPKNAHDPRTGLPVAHTRNPALLAAWFMTLPRINGGMGVPSGWIDWTSVTDAANICDELITVKKLDGSGTEQIKRYQCDIELSTANAPLDNLNLILATMAGSRAFTAGKYRLFAGAFRTSTKTITDADVEANKPIAITPINPTAKPPNMVTATFYDEGKNWVPSSAKPVKNATYLTEDGGNEEAIDLDLQGVSDERRANYLMGVALERARAGFEAALTVKGIGANLALGDAVTLDLTHYSAHASRTWEVTRYANNFDGTYTLRLRESKSTTWALDADRYTPTTQPTPPDLSYLWSIATPTGLDAESGTNLLQRLPDGTISSGVRLFWTQHPNEYFRETGYFEVRYLDPRTNKWVYAAPAPGDSTETILRPLLDGRLYVFEIRGVIPNLGVKSRWASKSHTVIGKTANPSDVTGFAYALDTGGRVELTWDSPPDVDLRRFELRTGGTGWSDATFLARVYGTQYRLPPQVDSIVVRIKAEDTTGHFSTNAVSVTVADIFQGPSGNLLPNSSFEIAAAGSTTVPEYWTTTSIGSGVSPVNALSTSVRFHGDKSYSLSLTPSGASTNNHTRLLPIDANIMPKVTPGRKYFLSAAFRTSTTTYKARLTVSWYDASLTIIDQGSGDTTRAINRALPATSTWYRVWHDFSALIAPANAAYARIGFGINRPSAADTTAGTMWFDAVMFSDGDSLTGYSPRDATTDDLLPGSATDVVSSFDASESVTRTAQTGGWDMDGPTAVYQNTSKRTVTLLLEASQQCTLSVSSGGTVQGENYLGITADTGVVFDDWAAGNGPMYSVTSAGGPKSWQFSALMVATVPPGDGITVWIRFTAGPASGSQTWTMTAKQTRLQILAAKTS